MSTREQNIVDRIQASTGVVDFNNAVYPVRRKIEFPTGNQTPIGQWKGIQNLTLLIDEEFEDDMVIELPLYTASFPRKILRNITILNPYGVAGITGIVTRSEGHTIEACSFNDLAVGISLRGANLTSMLSCHFDDCGIGLEALRRDEPDPGVGSGYVGNDNKCVNCRFETCGIGYKATGNAYEIGGSPSNGNAFVACTFEGHNVDLVSIDATVNVSFVNCRFEVTNTTAGATHYAIRLGDGTYGIQDVSITNCNFSLLTNNATATLYGIYAQSAASAVYAIGNFFDATQTLGTLTKTTGPIIASLNENGPSSITYGRLYSGTNSGASTGITSTPAVAPVPTVTLDASTSNFDEPSNGRLRYTGATTGVFRITCAIHCTSSAAITLRSGFYYYDDSAASGAVSTTTWAQIPTTAGGTGTLVLDDLITLDQNDYVELYTWALAGTSNLTIHSMTLTAVAVKG